MMMGLRLTEEGVLRERFRQRFGVDLAAAFAEPIRRLTDLGLLTWVQGPAGEALRLTPQARLVGNVVFREFVGVEEGADENMA